MGYTVAIAGQKGGVGKTTLSATIAIECLERGQRVLLVDADPQGSARTWGDVGAENGHNGPAVVAMGPGLHRPDQLPALKQAFDVVIIDCPPANGAIQRAALMVADLVLLPCSPSPVDVWALSSSIEVVQEAQILRPELLAAIVITQKSARTALGDQIRASLQDTQVPVLDTEIHSRVAYAEALVFGMGVTTYAQKSKAAKEAKQLVDELEAFIASARAAEGDVHAA